MNNGISNKFGISLNGAQKTVYANAASAPSAPKTASAAGFVADTFKTGQAAATPGARTMTDAQTVAEVRLANAYHADPMTFARNLAAASLNDLVSQVG